MDHIITLADVVQREVELYNEGKSVGAATFVISDVQRQTYAVVAIPDDFAQRPAWVIVMAHLDGNHIIVDEDRTDKPLVDALMINGGIPREQIVLAYAGETLAEHPTK